MEVPNKKTITFYYLKTIDSKFQICKRTEQPPVIVEELFVLDGMEIDAVRCIEELNSEQIDEEERENTS